MNQLRATKPDRPLMKALRTLVIALAIFLVYAYAVQATEISVEKATSPDRKEGFVRVLRLLADPDLVTRNAETGRLALSETSIIAIERIIETIFMALVASTIGTVLAVPVSFLAARNLMENVTAPLASIMGGVVALPFGLITTGLVSGQIMDLAARLSDTFVVGLVALAISGGALWAINRFVWLGAEAELGSARAAAFRIIRLLFIVLVSIFSLGLLANLGLVIGEGLEEALGRFGFLGNFIFVLADFTRLGLPAIVALLGGLIAVLSGSRYGQEAILKLTGAPARILTAVLSVVGTGVLVYGIGLALNWLYRFDNPEDWTTIPAIVGGGLAGVIGLVIAPKRPFAIGFAIYTISRSILNAIRAIEPLILGIVFVVWVSLGPFAGVMALALHSIAALGKLFSEQVEGISEGPLEAINSTGANRLQMIVFAVLPQVVPPFTAFTLYRWDINVRLSTIIGFVGGGGIGFVLSQYIAQLRYRQASVMMLAIAIVVATLDYVSSSIRRRII